MNLKQNKTKTTSIANNLVPALENAIIVRPGLPNENDQTPLDLPTSFDQPPPPIYVVMPPGFNPNVPPPPPGVAPPPHPPVAIRVDKSPYITKEPKPLMETRIRLSGANCQALWDKGYTFEDLKATICVADSVLPAVILKPTAWRPKDLKKRLRELPHETPLKLKDQYEEVRVDEDKYMVRVDENFETPTLIKWDSTKYRDCPCSREDNYRNRVDELEAMCDHKWHVWTCKRHLLPKDFSLVYYFRKGEWTAKITLPDGFQAISTLLKRDDAINEVIADAVYRSKDRVEGNMAPTNSDAGMASQDASGPEQLETVVSEGNVILTAARATSEAVTAEMKPTIYHSKYFTEETHVFPDLTNRPLALNPVEWNINQTPGQVIAQFNMPFDLLQINMNSPNRLPFLNHAWVRPNMTIHPQLQSVPANGGQLVIGVRYAALDEITAGSPWALRDVSQLLQTDHIIVSAQASNVGKIKVPFQYFVDRIPTTWTKEENMLYYFTLYVAVLNPLVVGDASNPTVTLNMYCTFEADEEPTEFYGQRQYFDPFARFPLEPVPFQSGSRRVDKLDVVTGNGLFDGIFGPVQNVIDGIGQATSGIMNLAESVGGIAAMVGFSAKEANDATATTGAFRPLAISDLPLTVLQPNLDLALGVGSMMAKSLRLMKDYMVPQPFGVMSHEPHFNTDYVKRIYGKRAHWTFSTSTPAGTLLHAWDVTPVTGFPIDDTTYQLTPLGSLANMFTYYSGPIEVKLVLGTSLLHSARIRFCYIPDYSDASVEGIPSLELRNSVYSVVYDVQEETALEFTIPYQCTTPMTPIWVNSFDDQNPTCLTYGRLLIYLETPLMANQAVSETVHCTLLVRAGENFSFACPRSTKLSPVPNDSIAYRNMFSIKVEEAMDTLDDEPMDVVTGNSLEERMTSNMTLTPAPSSSPSVREHIGEEHNIRDVVRRFTPIHSATYYLAGTEQDARLPTAAYLFFPVNASIPGSRASGIVVQGVPTGFVDPLTSLQDAFRFNKGSIRYMLTFNKPGLDVVIHHVPILDFNIPTSGNLHFTDLATIRELNTGEPGYLDNFLRTIHQPGLALDHVSTSYNTSITFEAPYISHTSTLLSDAVANNALENARSALSSGWIVAEISGYDPTVAYADFNIAIWRAAGSDWHASAFQGFPPVSTYPVPRAYQTAGRVPAPPADTQPDFNSVGANNLRRYKRDLAIATKRVENKYTVVTGNGIQDFILNTSRLPANLNGLIDQLSEFVGSITGGLCTITSNFNASSMLCHMLVLADPNNTTFSRVASFFGILSLFGVVNTNSLISLAKSAYSIVVNFLERKKTNNDRTVSHDLLTGNADSEEMLDALNDCKKEVAEFATLLTCGIASCFSISASKNIADAVTKIITTSSRITGLSRFFELLITCVDKVVRYCVGIKDPDTIARETLQKQSDELKQWSKEVDLICSMNNQDRVYNNAAYQMRVCEAKEKGTSIIQQVDEFPVGIRPSLMYFYRRISDVYDQVGMRVGGSNKPQEALSFWLYGPPGCGKSNMMDEFGVEVMRMMKVVHEGHPIYTRDGNPFWNGYTGQPCIKWDDVGVNRSPEFQALFAQEYFAVHTCASFNPNQADLKDKNRIVNARLIMVGSNSPSFASNCIGNAEAFARRRDFVICCRLRDSLKQKYPGLVNCNDPRVSAEELQAFDHLEFRLQGSLDRADHTSDSGFVGYQELLQTLRPLVLALDLKRKFAANKKNTLATALSTNYWLNVPQDERPDLSHPPLVQPLRTEIPIFEAPPLPPYIVEGPMDVLEPNSWLTKFGEMFMSRVTTKKELPIYSPVAYPPGTFPPLHETQLWDDWESAIDFTRVSCKCRNIDLHCEFDVDVDEDDMETECIWVLGERLYREPCGPNCCLTQSGVDRMWEELDYCHNVHAGYRIDDPRLSLYETPAEYFDAEAVRPAYNIHTLIDKILACKPAMMEFLETWGKLIAIFSFLVAVSLFDFSTQKKTEQARDHIYKCLRRLEEVLEECREAGIPDERIEGVLLTANLAVSGDVRTRGAAKQVPGHYTRVRGDAETDVVRGLRKNHIKFTFIGSKTYSIHGFGVKSRECLVPRHFAKQVDQLNATFLDIRIDSQVYHALTNLKSNSFMFNVPLSGSLRLCCTNRPYLYVMQSSSVPVNGRYEVRVAGVFDSPEPRVRISMGGLNTTVLFNSIVRKELLSHNDIDMELWLLPARVPEFKNITRLFANETEHKNTNLGNIELIDAGEAHIISCSSVKRVSRRFQYTGLDEYHPFIIGYEYKNPSGYYPCMSVLWNPVFNKILGFHVASNASLGFAELVALDHIPTCVEDRLEPEVVDAPTKINLTGEYIEFGASPNSVSYPGKSKIEPSLLNAELPSKRYPCKLRSPGEPLPCHDVIKRGCEKQLAAPPDPDSEHEYISTFLHDRIIREAKPVRTPESPLSLEVAINGLPGVPFVDAMDLKTSAGFPWCTIGKSSKSDLIKRNAEGVVTHIDTAFADKYNEEHALRLKGIRPAVVFVDFPKDERLKPGKDTRLINGSPLTYTLEVRRYFLDFVAALQANNLACNVGVGLNVHGPDVTKLIRYMQSRGHRYICGDYSNFGPTLDPDCVNKLAELVNAWYDFYCPTNTPEANMIRTQLLSDSATSYHLAFNLLYQVACGSPSGSPLTVVVNSYVNLRYLCRAWLRLTKTLPAFHSLDTFFDLVAIVVYGDDVIMCTTTEVTEFFNNQTLSDYFSLIGITYTDATKTGTEPYCEFDRANFLKNTFRPHPTRPGQYLAGLDVDLIPEVCAWIRKSPDQSAATAGNIHAALYLAHGHGPEYFNKFIQDVRPLAVKHSLSVDFKTWKMIDDNFFDSSSNGIIFPKMM